MLAEPRECLGLKEAHPAPPPRKPRCGMAREGMEAHQPAGGPSCVAVRHQSNAHSTLDGGPPPSLR